MPGTWSRDALINVLLIALACGLLAALAGMVLYYSDLILPGVSTLGIDLGGKTRGRAATLLEEAWQSYTLTLRVEDTSWTATARSLGLGLDAQATAAQAYRQSRVFRPGRGPVVISPVLHIDIPTVQAALNRLAAEVYLAPQDAGVRIVNGRLETIPARPGRELNVEATTNWLIQSAHQTVSRRVFDLTTRTLPPAVSNIDPLIERGNAWLTRTLLIQAYDPIADETWSWPAEPPTWIVWMTLKADPSAPTGITWTLDAAQVTAFVQAQAGVLGETRYLKAEEVVDQVQQAIQNESWRARLRVYHTPRTHMVQFGETISSIARQYGMPYPWVQQANPGVQTLTPGQKLLIPSPDSLLPLPIVEGKRIVVSLARQVMWAYENGIVKWVWPVSTGIPSSPTSPGVFQIQSHEENAYAASWNLWMPYFMGIYRPVPTADFMNGFHGFPTRDGATLLWTGNLGTPVTYGCILLETGNAAALYQWAQDGVIVEIKEE